MPLLDGPGTRRLIDHAPPSYRVERVQMAFDLGLRETRVQCGFTVRRGPAGGTAPIVLWGRGDALERITLDGRRVQPSADELARGEIALHGWGDVAAVRVTTRLRPARNHTMLGLYASAGSLLTQCEAEGFRCITWFPDRPDVIAPYAVLLRACRHELPVLLCNGDLVQAGLLSRGRHYAYWVSPEPKPAYLFALAAGRFGALESTRPGVGSQHTRIQLWSAGRTLPALHWAQRSLLQAMDWDSTRFGLPLDMPRYMVLAAHDTNCEAMENQGLNIFNAEHLLATPQQQTDADHLRVWRIVAHEYFHHWTGNRVTLRDWFQLGLKEGLTTLREQLFAADMRALGLQGEPAAMARAVSRISDLRRLFAEQWLEDSSPLAHPVRLEQVVDVANFYTPTVYDKAAEVMRLLHTRLGEARFVRSLREFLQRHTGTAVAFDDFFAHMASGGAAGLGDAARWVSQTGRPAVRAVVRRGPRAGTVTVTATRIRPGCHRAADGGLVPVGLRVRWVAAAGAAGPLPGPFAIELGVGPVQRVLTVPGGRSAASLALCIEAQAPGLVEVRTSTTKRHQLTIAQHHPDAVSRWAAAQALARRCFASPRRPGAPDPAHGELLLLQRAVLARTDWPDAYRAEMLTLPDDAVLGQAMTHFDPATARQRRQRWLQRADHLLAPAWRETWGTGSDNAAGRMDGAAFGRRALMNLALTRWLGSGDAGALTAAFARLQSSASMDDQAGALAALLATPLLAADARCAALDVFFRRHANEPLAKDKWFAAQACAATADAALVAQLLRHKGFRMRRPNHVRALLSTFMNTNPGAFHAADAHAYALWQDLVPRIDRFNDELASELVRGFMLWRRLPQPQRRAAGEVLQSLASRSLSSTTRETVCRLLGKRRGNDHKV